MEISAHAPAHWLDDIPTSWYAIIVSKIGARERLIDAAVSLFRLRGYCATSVDDLCGRAGVTKGAFFHHFKSKEALAVAAADHFTQVSASLFEAADYRTHEDPLDRILNYLDLRKAMVVGALPDISCLAGTMLQETYASHPSIARACEASICGHAETLEADIAAAMARHRVGGDWTAQSLALHIQAVQQGGFILAKAKGGSAVAAESIDHLKRYIGFLFGRLRPERAATRAAPPSSARKKSRRNH